MCPTPRGFNMQQLFPLMHTHMGLNEVETLFQVTRFKFDKVQAAWYGDCGGCVVMKYYVE